MFKADKTLLVKYNGQQRQEMIIRFKNKLSTEGLLSKLTLVLKNHFTSTNKIHGYRQKLSSQALYICLVTISVSFKSRFFFLLFYLYFLNILSHRDGSRLKRSSTKIISIMPFCCFLLPNSNVFNVFKVFDVAGK